MGKKGKEIIKEILDKEPKIWRCSDLLNRAMELTGRSDRTVKKWIVFYRDHQNLGVLHFNEGKYSYYLSEKYKDLMEERYLIIEIEKYLQKLVTNKKGELGTAAFDYWLKNLIQKCYYKIYSYRINKPETTIVNERGETGKPFNLLDELKFHTYKIGESYYNLHELDFIRKYDKDKLIEQCHVIPHNILNAVLSHPDKEIKGKAWEYFTYYEEKLADSH